MDMARMIEEDSWTNLCYLLSSTRLDSCRASSRNLIVEKAHNDFLNLTIGDQSLENVQILCSGLGDEVVNRCSSLYSFHRVYKLLTKSISILFLLSSDKNEVNLVQDFGKLASCLCLLLVRWKEKCDYEMNNTRDESKKRKTKHSSDKYQTPTSNAVILDLIIPFRSADVDVDVMYVLRQMMEVFLKISEKVSTVKNAGYYAPAISLTYSILVKLEGQDKEKELISVKRDDLLELFVKKTIGTAVAGKYASKSEIELCKPFVQSFTQKELDEKLISVIALKLRSKPEPLMKTFISILSLIVSPSPHFAESPLLHHLEGDSKLVASVLRQLKSPKSDVRDYAISLLETLAFPACLKSFSAILNVVSAGLVSKQSDSLATPDHREAAFLVLRNISNRLFLFTKEQSGGNNILKDSLLSGSLEKTIATIVTVLEKESTKNLSTKHVGNEALVSLLFVSSVCETKVSTESLSSYFSKPVLDIVKSKSVATTTMATTELRLRMQYLLTNNNNTGTNDVVKSIINEIFKQCPTLEKSLEALITNKNKVSSASIPQIDALISVYLCLLQYSVTKTMPPQYVIKVFSSKTSFLYSDGLLKQIQHDQLVGNILPRSIALFCKTYFPLEEEPENATNVFNDLFGSKNKKVYEGDMVYFSQSGSPAALTLATFLTNPYPGTTSPSCSLVSPLLKTILTYVPNHIVAANAIVDDLFFKVNSLSNKNDEELLKIISTRKSRELFEPINENNPISSKHRGKLVSMNHCDFDSCTIRFVAKYLSEYVGNETDTIAKILLLGHVGTSSNKTQGKQRKFLENNTLNLLEDFKLPKEYYKGDSSSACALSTLISSFATFPLEKKSTGPDESKDSKVDISTSQAIHGAALSLIITIGSLGGTFDPVFDDPNDEDTTTYAFSHSLSVNHIAEDLSKRLTFSADNVSRLDENDICLFLSQEGVLFLTENATNDASGANSSAPSNNAAKKRTGGKSRKQKGDFGASFEDEEWEREMKKQMAAKKQAESGNKSATAKLSPNEQKLLEQQTKTRKELAQIINVDFIRCLTAVQALFKSDVEVGNSCLQLLAKQVIDPVVSVSPAFLMLMKLKQASFDTLCDLAACIFELDESLASDLATSLRICYRQDINPPTLSTTLPEIHTAKSGMTTSSFSHITISALPSTVCESILSVFKALDEYNDCLSGNSFAFVFPILCASLTGPRTVPGTESALEIIKRHTALITGDDPDKIVTSMRRDIAMVILELLSHDRAIAFSRPTATETLSSCYIPSSGENGYPSNAIFSAGDMAPLLGENGTLGGDKARLASVIALSSIASEHPKFIKNNLLSENRVWMNCFDENEDVKQRARETWLLANSCESIDGTIESSLLLPPSKMYSVPLLPLLSHKNASVAHSSAKSFAFGMTKHPDTIEQNVIRLCKMFIDVFPIPLPEEKNTPIAPKLVTPAEKPKKKPLVKKKTTTRRNPASLAAGVPKLGKPRKSKSKSSSLDILKPKKERQLDTSDFANQFKETNVKKGEADDEKKVSVRLGVLRVFSDLSNAMKDFSLDYSTLKLLVGFLMAYGLADSNEKVRNTARDAARDIVSNFGESENAINFLLPHFESVLSSGKADETCLGDIPSEKVPRDTLASDRRKEGAVLCLASTVIHLKGEENIVKIDTTIDMLIATLRTPSEEVQSSVALCLSKLMKKGRTSERIETILSDLMTECLENDSLAMRRGSAYGISAVVKGSGIATLKKFNIVKQLEEACTSSSSTAKEGSLFAIELLSGRLGLLFEPYVIVLLPALLKAFSDSNDYVRSAAANTVGLIMSKLSAHGVKLVMPAVLTAFSEPAWRTKQASIHMLGSMSHLAPKQLASSLPKIVPRLTEAFADTHPKVKSSAEGALEEICRVIKNPEISSISPVLLKALTDPSNETITALEALIETEFLHAIDAPSLALLVPILHRGLRDRTAKTKRYGALISGNICTMINDPRDFLPYLPTLIPDLKAALLDPIPDVRSTSAKALGSLTRGLGEESLPDLRPWLVETLKAETGSAVERSGAAQGLTEVLIAGGTGLVDSVMREEILPLKSHPKSSTREGVLWILTFMPSSLGQAFAPLIDISLPALLSGLSDDNEQVRDVALRAGRVIIRSHGKAHVNKILPNLEQGLMDDDWRIRVSSLTLLGDLLSMIGGTKVVKGDATQDDIRQAERAQAQIALALGNDTRKRVLSGLYFARSDSTSAVRQSAVQVWKTIVSVTPRTLREILDVLVGKIVDALASGHPEHTQIAGHCLGDIVTKLGDAVLPEIIPVLRDELYRGGQHTRRGVCLGLTEVINCASKDQIKKFLNILVKAVQDALCDEDEGVRKMAASCFQSLHNVAGSRASDEIVPALLVAMEKNDENSRQRALNGLTGILSIRSRELLPYLVTRLMKKPITSQNADALGAISAVTGGTLHHFLKSIVPPMLEDLENHFNNPDDDDDERIECIRNCARAIFRNIEEVGVNSLVSTIVSKSTSDKAGIRKEACWMLGALVEERQDYQDYFEQIPLMYRDLLYRLNDDNSDVLKAVNIALMSIAKCVPAEELVNHIDFCKNLIASIVSDARRRKGGVGDGEFLLPGFNMPKGLEPLLPMYQRGILYGTASVRETAASGLGELISITSKKYLAGAFIIKMTGPLLRVVGDRNPSAVKIAIVRTLALILSKGGMALRAFVPQFQTTFVKALSDPSRQVRIEAIKALALLMPLSTRVDPLMKELVNGLLSKGGTQTTNMETAGIIAVQTATLDALATVLKCGGKKAKLPDSIPSALKAGKELVFHEDEGIRECAAKVIGVACELLDDVNTSIGVLQEQVLETDSADSNVDVKHGRMLICHRILASREGSKIDDELYRDVSLLITKSMVDENIFVRSGALQAVGALLGSSKDDVKIHKLVQPSLLKSMNTSGEDIEVHRGIAKGLIIAVQMKPDIFRGEIGLPVLNGALKLAMSSTQKVQLAFNNFLWLAMRVGKDDEELLLEEYSNIASFENVRTMKALVSKVLSRMKDIELDD